MDAPIEVYALRYATMHGRKASEVFYRYDVYCEDDRLLDMDCYFWLVRNGSVVTLVDCGWHRHRGLPKTGRYSHIKVDEADPVGLLAQLDVTPADVTNVVVSHMHFDHIGNLDLFDEATVTVARAEYECWTGCLGTNPALSLSILPEEVAVMKALEAAGRLRLIDQRTEISPAIVATPVGGHTPGQLVVEVTTDGGTVVLASDAVHYREELEKNRPFYHFSDLVATLETYDALRRREDTPRTRIVTGHDPLEMDRYATVSDDIVDLTKPLV